MMPIIRIMAVMLSAVGIFGLSAPAFAQICWTTVGSAGTVDEADSSIVALDSNTVAVRGSANVGTVNIRYNIADVSGPFSGTKNAMQLTARMADNGPAAQVVIRIIQLNVSSGELTTLGELNSNSFPPTDQAQARSTFINCDGPDINFSSNVYYADVELIKTAAEGNPLLRAIRLCPGACAVP
jgi:hypothetical protein